MFLWPSVKGHSHIAEEMPQILASGFCFFILSWHSYNGRAFLCFKCFHGAVNTGFSHKRQRTVVRPEAICFCSAFHGRASLKGLLFQREPRTRKQTNRIPHKYKFCIKLDTYSRLNSLYNSGLYIFWASGVVATLFKVFHLYLVWGSSSAFLAAWSCSFQSFFCSLRREPDLIAVHIKCVCVDMDTFFQLYYYFSPVCHLSLKKGPLKLQEMILWHLISH